MFKAAFLFLTMGVMCGCYFLNYNPAPQRHAIAIALPIEDNSEREIGCIRDVIYNEARGEHTLGQIAVGATVINRLVSSKWQQRTACEIVKAPKQFKWKLGKIKEPEAYAKAERIARYVYCNWDKLEGMHGLHFFDSNSKRKGGIQIGRHTFYA